MESLTVGLAERSYHIFFGSGVLPEIGPLCRELQIGSKVAVVTNTTVGPLYAQPVMESLTAAGFKACCVELPDGEEFKNASTLNLIYDGLVDNGMDRGSCIVALGGGVVGDMAGFAAATFLRGIPFVQVPTTLLAQVDSSVGGKTGINHSKGKNLIGAFYQPRLVLVDSETLDTLPEREYLSGLAEVAKYGVALDGELFRFMRDNTDALLNRNKEAVQFIIKRSCAIKASIVEKDEREGGLRAVLNFGHTMGHAVETLTGYSRFKHGEAVAIGMVQAARFAEAMGYATASDTAEVVDLLLALHLPVSPPAYSRAAYTEAVFHDKKAREGGLNFVFNSGIGNFRIERVTDISLLLSVSGIGG